MVLKDCLNWVVKSWKDLDTSGVVKKAKELGMTSELGPEIEGFEDGNFQDEQPSGNEVEVLDPEFEEDINAED